MFRWKEKDEEEKEKDERDHYLLEINLEDLETSTGENQHYWLLQIEAARCKLALRRQNNNSNNRNYREGERTYDFLLVNIPWQQGPRALNSLSLPGSNPGRR